MLEKETMYLDNHVYYVILLVLGMFSNVFCEVVRITVLAYVTIGVTGFVFLSHHCLLDIYSHVCKGQL